MNQVTPAFRYEPFVMALLPSTTGAIDIVGDVHGCMEELMALLEQAGYQIDPFDPRSADPIGLSHPEGRKLVFVGDLTDRGPASDQVLRLAMGARRSETAFAVMGNHDWKLLRCLAGNPVKMANGLARTLEQMEPLGADFARAVLDFYDTVPHQLRLPLPGEHCWDGAEALWVVHASAHAHRQGQADKRSFERSIYGYPTEALDPSGAVVRKDWAQDYEGADPVVHGHTPLKVPRQHNRVICVDTGCVFGNAMTLYQVDHNRFLQEPARANHSGKDRTLG